jgi:hypothetical protein
MIAYPCLGPSARLVKTSSYGSANRPSPSDVPPRHGGGRRCQQLRFVPARGGHGEGIIEVSIAGLPMKGEGEVGGGPWMIGGVRFAGEEG